MSILMGVSGLMFAKPLNHIVIFGDSLSDNGNLYAYSHHQIPPSPPYYDGRFSNGPLWVEFVARKYFPLQEMEHYFSDYAFGGAGVGEKLMKDSALLTLKKEVDTYLLANHGKADANRLYMVWIGANNYLGLPPDPENTVSAVNEGIAQELNRLVKAGAEHVLVINLPDLGKTPFAHSYSAQKPLTEFSIRHNAALQEKVTQLEHQYPAVQWLYFDVNQMFNEFLTHPDSFGFTNVTDACYKTSGLLENLPADSLKMVTEVQKTESLTCAGYLFFDAIHPTVLTHEMMAMQIQAFIEQAGIELTPNA